MDILNKSDLQKKKIKDFISKNICKAEYKINENMAHWLQLYLSGKIDKNLLNEMFSRAYFKEEFINKPKDEKC